jgi:hypothetical protein
LTSAAFIVGEAALSLVSGVALFIINCQHQQQQMSDLFGLPVFRTRPPRA